MLRMFGKTTWLAAALIATATIGFTQSSSGQDPLPVDQGAMPIEEHAVPLAEEAAPLAEGVVDDCQDGSCPVGAAGAGGCGLFNQSYAQNCRPRYYGQPELFYNYYIPGTCGGVPANMYLAPQPVPAWVGHTYYTYQPLMPHELLYNHHRTYYRYYNGGRGLTRTSVSWYRPPLSGWYSSLRIAR